MFLPWMYGMSVGGMNVLFLLFKEITTFNTVTNACYEGRIRGGKIKGKSHVGTPSG